MSEFLLSLRQRDFTPSYTRSGKEQDELHEAFETINTLFLHLNAEKEQQARYLQTVVAHVQVALLSFNQKEEVTLFNETAQQLFQQQYLRHLKQLNGIAEDLYPTVRSLRAGDQRLVKIMQGGELLLLSVRATEFKLQAEHYTLVAFSDIRHELEAQEVESWQKLIRVLTHEIMNSAIPITTLTDVTHSMLLDPQGNPRPLETLDAEEQEDLRGSLETIARRSKGLVAFVNAYKDLNQVPQPQLAMVAVGALVQSVARLMASELEEAKVTLELAPMDAQLTVLADAELLEQVLINLLGNARDAVASQEAPRILLTTERVKDRVRISVQDNGPGIATEHLDKIFIPFFTTKPQGTGIGLALSRQIIRAHQGSLTVSTQPNQGSTFVVEL